MFQVLNLFHPKQAQQTSMRASAKTCRIKGCWINGRPNAHLSDASDTLNESSKGNDAELLGRKSCSSWYFILLFDTICRFYNTIIWYYMHLLSYVDIKIWFKYKYISHIPAENCRIMDTTINQCYGEIKKELHSSPKYIHWWVVSVQIDGKHNGEV